MNGNVTDYTNLYITEYKKKKRWRAVVAVLGVAVAVTTAYKMSTPAHTMEQNTFCSYAEHKEHSAKDGCFEIQKILICGEEECQSHTHTAECFEKRLRLNCTLEENEEHIHGDGCYEEEDVLICGTQECEGHTHSEECYREEEVLVCEKAIHTHTLQCYSDPSADTETEAVMAQSVSSVQLTGNRSEDVAAVAETQLGYCESEKNYYVRENGTVSGYTRYGDWGGAPYKDWGMLFCSFCCKYAGADTEYLTDPEYCDDWKTVLRENNLFFEKEYTAQRGDIVFLADEKDEAGNTDNPPR